MNFRKSFEIPKDRVEKIPAFYKARGLKMDACMANYYRFKRGSIYFGQIARDIRSLPTQIDVILEEKEEQKVQVLVLYDIDVMGKFVPISQRETIKEELADLMREAVES